MPARIFFRETRLFAQQRRESGRCGPLVMRCPPMPEPPQPSDGGRRHLQVCPFRARVPSRWEQFVAAGYLPIGLVNEKLTFQIRPVAGPQVQRIGGAGVRDGYAHEHSVGYGFRQAAAATHDRKPVGHDRRKQLLKCGPPPLFVGGDRNRSAFGCDPVCHSRQRHVRTFFRTDGWPHLHILRIDRDVGTCRVVRRWTRRFLSFRHAIPPLPPEDGRGQASRRYAMRRLAGWPRALQILTGTDPDPYPPLPLLGASSPSLYMTALAVPSAKGRSTAPTCTCVHLPPRAVGTLRSLSFAAMALRLAAPAFSISCAWRACEGCL